ncbi:MAG: DUF2142 domain-containing protein [Propionibacteriaceae bacterium]|jgi:uncharacterized membrane protein|nr:DUF2142 domain-containing protein [Propionibacteriaceae bacterium]
MLTTCPAHTVRSRRASDRLASDDSPADHPAGPPAGPPVWRRAWHKFISDPAWFFFVVGTIFGLAMAVFIPLGNTPDENSHMARAYEVAHLRLMAEKTDGMVGVVMPASLVDPVARTDAGQDVRAQPGLKFSFARGLSFLISTPLNKDDVVFRPTGGTATYSAVSYIPQAIAVRVGLAANLPPGSIYLLAKLFTLFVHAGLGFLTIRLWPVKPWALAAILLLPMMVAQSVSPGADAMTLSLAGLLMALVLRLRLTKDGPKLSAWALIGLGALGTASALTKPVMALFPVLFWMIPDGRLRPGRSIVIKMSLIVTPILLSAAWLLISQATVGAQATSHGHDMGGQIDYLLAHPLAAILVFVRTWYTDFSVTTLRSMAGTFGWMDTDLPVSWVIVVFIAMTSYLVCYRRRPPMLEKWPRAFLAAWALVLLYGTSMALYIGWTPPGHPLIEGVQGRYLLPMLFLLLPVSPDLARLRRRGYAMLTKTTPILLLVVSMVYIIGRYYISPLDKIS